MQIMEFLVPFWEGPVAPEDILTFQSMEENIKKEEAALNAQKTKEEAQKSQQLMQTDNFAEYVLAQLIFNALSVYRVNGAIYYWDKVSTRFRLLDAQAAENMIFRELPQITQKKRCDILVEKAVKRICVQAESLENFVGYTEFVALRDLNFSCYDGCFYKKNMYVTPCYALDASYRDGSVYPADGAKFEETNILLEKCERFDRYLEDISGGDEELQNRIWEAIGYLLVPDQKGKVCILLQGVPNSGKTVLGELIRSCFYNENVVATDIIELKTDSDRKELLGKTLLINTELTDSVLKRKTINIIKQLTGNDLLQANSPIKSRKKIKFKNQAKILLATNAPVDLRAGERAIESRIVVIPFAYEVDPQNKDVCLLDKLKREKNAIVMKALIAYRRLKLNKYVFSGDYPLNDVLDIRYQEDALIESFLSDECYAYENCTTLTKDLYDCFCEKYSDKYSFHHFSRLFMLACKQRGYAVERDRPLHGENGEKNTKRGIKGIVLKKNCQTQTFNV